MPHASGGLTFAFDSLDIGRGDAWERVPPPSFDRTPPQLSVAIRNALGPDLATRLAEAAQKVKVDDNRPDRLERRYVLKIALGLAGVDLADDEPVVAAIGRMFAPKGAAPDAALDAFRTAYGENAVAMLDVMSCVLPMEELPMEVMRQSSVNLEKLAKHETNHSPEMRYGLANTMYLLTNIALVVAKAHGRTMPQASDEVRQAVNTLLDVHLSKCPEFEGRDAETNLSLPPSMRPRAEVAATVEERMTTLEVEVDSLTRRVELITDARERTSRDSVEIGTGHESADGYDSCDESNHVVASSGWMRHTNVVMEPTAPSPAPPIVPSRDSVTQLIQRVRSTRARAPQGTAADVAYVLCAAPAMFPSMNACQCNELLHAFLARPKQTLARTARSVLFPDARSRELACPILTSMLTILDDIFSGQNWERSVVQFTGTQAGMSVAQFIAELRLAYPEQHAPTSTQRAASVLAQYRELNDVFVDCQCVSTTQVNKFFRGELQLGGSGQTELERAGPECWLALCELMGYPTKPISEYGGTFCTDHMIERSLYTTRGRDTLTVADTLSNYAMLLGFFNEQGRMKVFGMEKRGWYTEKWADMAKTAMRFRLDFVMDTGRMPTVAEFATST